MILLQPCSRVSNIKAHPTAGTLRRCASCLRFPITAQSVQVCSSLDLPRSDKLPAWESSLLAPQSTNSLDSETTPSFLNTTELGLAQRPSAALNPKTDHTHRHPGYNSVPLFRAAGFAHLPGSFPVLIPLFLSFCSMDISRFVDHL